MPKEAVVEKLSATCEAEVTDDTATLLTVVMMPVCVVAAKLAVPVKVGEALKTRLPVPVVMLANVTPP